MIKTQVIGVAAAFVWSFTLTYVLFKLLKYTVGLRVDKKHEREGLDENEHGLSAYPEIRNVQEELKEANLTPPELPSSIMRSESQSLHLQ